MRLPHVPHENEEPPGRLEVPACSGGRNRSPHGTSQCLQDFLCAGRGAIGEFLRCDVAEGLSEHWDRPRQDVGVFVREWLSLPLLIDIREPIFEVLLLILIHEIPNSPSWRGYALGPSSRVRSNVSHHEWSIPGNAATRLLRHGELSWSPWLSPEPSVTTCCTTDGTARSVLRQTHRFASPMRVANGSLSGSPLGFLAATLAATGLHRDARGRTSSRGSSTPAHTSRPP